MKFLIALALTSIASSALAEKDYIAKLNEDGKYCARVEIQSVGHTTTTRRKCRTIEEWIEAGYVISEKKSQEADGEFLP